METTSDKILNRIRNLLDMSRDTSSPNEAAIAAIRARKLMDKYQVHELDLTTVSADEMGTRLYSTQLKTANTFYGLLGVGVAKFNDCQARYERHRISGDLNLVFEGMLADTVCATEMFKYLRDEAYAQAEAQHTTRRDRHAYRIGFASGVCAQIKEYMKEREALNVEVGANAGTALVICKQQLVAKHFNPVKYKRTKNEYTGSRSAHGDGYAAGKRAGLNRQVTGAVQGKLN